MYPPQSNASRSSSSSSSSSDQDTLHNHIPQGEESILDKFRLRSTFNTAWGAIRLPESANPYSKLLPNDPEADDLPNPVGWTPPRRKRRWIVLSIIAGVIVLFVVVLNTSNGLSRQVPEAPVESPKPTYSEAAFSFNETRPAWFDEPYKRDPLVLRVALVSKADEFERRQGLRESVFYGTRESEVMIHYRFFVGTLDNATHAEDNARLEAEKALHGDVAHLKIPDIQQRLSEKRFEALKWGGSMNQSNYDYFMTMDSDTFVRFGLLARRLPRFFESKNATVDPRKDMILIGRMGVHHSYFQNTVPDGNENPDDEDQVIVGPWFSYPIGIGYMLSSALTTKFLSAEPSLPHHIHYPSDDVMIGAWMAGMEFFPDKTQHFETPQKENSTIPVETVIPRPFFPEVVKTTWYDDKEGWHDFYERGGQSGVFGWNSVAVHHVRENDMMIFRAMDAIKGEWDS